MEISNVLQVALFLASLAFIVLVICLVPLAFQARRRLERFRIADIQGKYLFLRFMQRDSVS